MELIQKIHRQVLEGNKQQLVSVVLCKTHNNDITGQTDATVEMTLWGKMITNLGSSKV